MIILKAELMGGIEGKEQSPYRAVLEGGRYGAVLSVHQPFKDGTWGRCSGWYLTTLMKNNRDEISIDYGQSWSISSGMQEALKEAITICLDNYTGKEDLT